MEVLVLKFFSYRPTFTVKKPHILTKWNVLYYILFNDNTVGLMDIMYTREK